MVLTGCSDDEPLAASRSGAVVWAVGDGGNGSDAARRVADLIGADRPRLVLYLGDVYETGTAADFRERFATVYRSLVRRMDPTPGNHDWPHHAVGYDPYWRKVKGRRLPHHYALNVDGWRIISVNSQTPRNAKQLAFLRRELAGVKRGCAIVFMHRPRFNAGAHRDEERDVDPLWQALRGKAAILLSGHDYDLQRFRPVSGTTQYVIGAGGRERYDVDAHDPRLAFSRDSTDGALRLRLKPGSAAEHRRRRRRSDRPLNRPLLARGRTRRARGSTVRAAGFGLAAQLGRCEQVVGADHKAVSRSPPPTRCRTRDSRNPPRPT